MDARFTKNRDFDSENSPENSGGSPVSAVLPDDSDARAAVTSSKPSKRRAVQKRVVSVPITDSEGSKIKNEISFPPSDSWAWRKYGQKPIKGSPYPRGYYRCSSSKGCPAKKQVERSRVDPQMLVVTYSCEHNHSWPATTAAARIHRTSAAAVAGAATPKTSSRSNNKDGRKEATAVVSDSEDGRKEASDPDLSPRPVEAESDDRGAQFSSHLGGGGGVEEFGWFSNFDQTASAVAEEECSVLAEAKLVACTDEDMPSLIFPAGEEDGEDESLFADLGELPECSREFGLGMMERDESRRRQSLPPWCGTA
ncbi:unnamed protein product [Cuscuta campestris]|uniref:WRKY domain-containing protein n=1 Tax=Cuscuta campestris TaxID=132261 RepID=A0A484LZ82_9ASTE|nr:unnamed protein product [Cuscuta campestris]